MEYEANKSDDGNNHYGGVRVFQVTSFSSYSSSPSIKKYVYSQAFHAANLWTYYNERIINRDMGYITVHSLSANTSFGTSIPIQYKNIRIYDGLNGENGYEEFQYNIAFDYPVGFSETIMGSNVISPPPVENSGINNGELQTQSYYRNDNDIFKLVKRIEYNYNTSSQNSITNYFVSIRRTGNATLTSGSDECGSTIFVSFEFGKSNLVFDVSKYRIFSKWRYPISEKTIFYDNNGSTINYSVLKNFEYNNPYHSQLTKQTIIDSNGIENSTKLYYPDDYTVSSMNLLKSKHIVGIPVKTEFLSNSNLIGGIISIFNEFGNIIESYRYESESVAPPISHNPSILLPNDYQKRTSYAYDPLTYVLNDVVVSDNILTSYIWNDDHRYPIAKAENAISTNIAHTSFETVEKGGWTYSGSPIISSNAKTGSNYYNLGTGSISKSGIGASTANKFRLTFWARRSSGTGNWTFLGETESLSTAWKLVEREVTNSAVSISGSGIYVDELRLHPVEALMTTYTYDPLVGMKTKTDARNYTMYFDYDTFGRLKTIKDENGQIKEHYDYNYQSSEINP